MPASRRILTEVEHLNLDPTKPHRHIGANGRLRAPASAIEVSDAVRETQESTEVSSTNDPVQVVVEDAIVDSWPSIPEAPVLPENSDAPIEEPAPVRPGRKNALKSTKKLSSE